MQNALIYVWIYPQQIQQKWQSYKFGLDYIKRYV